MPETPLDPVHARIAFGPCRTAMQPAIPQLIRTRTPAGMNAGAIAYASSFQLPAMGFAQFVAWLIGPVFELRACFTLNVPLTAGALWWWLRASRASAAG